MQPKLKRKCFKILLILIWVYFAAAKFNIFKGNQKGPQPEILFVISGLFKQPRFLHVVRRSRLFVMLFMVCAIVRVICGFGAQRRAECLTFCARLAHSGPFSIFALLPRTASALCVLTSCRFVARCAAFYIICGGCLWCLYPVFLPPRRKLFR